MLLPSHAEPMARALIEAGCDAHSAVYALVKESNANKYGEGPHSCIALAKALVVANEEVQENAESVIHLAVGNDARDIDPRTDADLDYIEDLAS